jgi:hypothetical protein
MNNRILSYYASFRKNSLLIGLSLIICGVGAFTLSDTNPLPVAVNPGSAGDTLFITNTAWKVPHDVSSANPSQAQLARFAWKEFIALNWPSSYSINKKRGTPDTAKTAMDFLAAGQHPNNPLVWNTYMHRVELFPDDTANFKSSFDTPPHYAYADNIPNIDNPAILLGSVDTIFNNLDETSEINLCTVFTTGDATAPGAVGNPGVSSFLPGAPRRVIYEAKANKVFYKYVKKKKLYVTTHKKKLSAYTKRKISNATLGDTLGGLYPNPQNDSLISFTHGVTGGSEGSIEVKASWRQLSATEYNSGRFLTAPVLYYRKGKPSNTSDTTVYYQVISGKVTATHRPFGLVGLHIIHKTQYVPTYVFATFEQVDNLAPRLPQNDLFLYNRNWNVVVDSGKQNIVSRIHSITSTTTTVNDQVHRQVNALDTSSVWRYYKLIGVQGPANGNQDTTNFLLANIVTETNEVLANFVGTLDGINGVIKNPNGVNVHKGSKSYVQGGCKGCHGNSQSTDFSFITADGPFDGKPDVVNQPILLPGQNGGPLKNPTGTVNGY